MGVYRRVSTVEISTLETWKNKSTTAYHLCKHMLPYLRRYEGYNHTCYIRETDKKINNVSGMLNETECTQCEKGR